METSLHGELFRQLDRDLVIVDVGCRWGFSDVWQNFSSRLSLYGFDPDPLECERLRHVYEKCKVTLVPQALAEAPGKRLLYLTQEPACSSLYRPDPRFVSTLPALACAVQVGIEQIDVTTLDIWSAAMGVTVVDYIKLDTQGSELDILRGGKNILRTVRALEIEVEFNPIYEGQPLFADIDKFLREQGFVLWRLSNMVHYSRGIFQHERQNDDTSNYDFTSIQHNTLGGQLYWGHAYYLRDEVVNDENRIHSRQCLRDAFLLETLGFSDIAFRLSRLANVARKEENMSQTDDRVPTRVDVVNAYEVLLGRSPESEAVIANHVASASTFLGLIRNLAASPEFAARAGTQAASLSPFVHFNANVDVRGIIESHVQRNRMPLADHYVNFLGVAAPVKVMAHIGDKGGQLEAIPIPANYHADMSEWAAALRAVDLARDKFVMLELGCGWGCWMNNTGVAAKARGLKVHLIGIEGDERHLNFARETLAINSILSSEYTLIRGIAAARPGDALFPKQHLDHENWGLEPVFGVSHAAGDEAVASGKFERLRMVPLADAIADQTKVDLLHMDIQGGEADLVAQTIALLSEKVAYLVIGTHSRAIEGKLFDTLLSEGWLLEIERPAIFSVIQGKPQTTVDGVQGWKNPKFHSLR